MKMNWLRSYQGHEAVISSYNPGWSNPDIRSLFVKGSKAIIGSVKQSGIKRLIVIGGAGSLYVKPGLQLVDTKDFPNEYKDGALGAREVLDILKNETDLDWTFVSPSTILAPGERTGKFRIGNDQLLLDENGESRISTQDLAMAIINEIETPKFIKERFTVGY